MLSQIAHRGPDESGMFLSGPLAMGNVRLKIIDLEGGTQPICDQSQRYWIVFNGEIYNYLELKEELIKKGYRFQTKSDTEVLVQLFACYGKHCLDRLNGQFAFAIWDQKESQIFLARDRVGIRPLYYTFHNGSLLFASEIKAFLAYEDLSLQINPRSLQQTFTLWAPLSPQTAFKDVYEIPPAHYAIFRKGAWEVKRYWDLSFSSTQSISLSTALEEFETLLFDSVKLRLRSDVPVAAYLSGGIDSTATTRFIKLIQPENLQTFSIGFEDGSYDETLYQQEASHYLNTVHKRITCNNEDIARHFAETIWHGETPILRTAPVPMYLLSRLVRENGIKVVVTGEGADEMLAGYNIFKETLIRQFWARQPESRYRPLLLKKLYPYIPYIKNANPALLKMFFGYRLEETTSPIYSHMIRWNNTSRILHYLSPDLLNGSAHYLAQEEVQSILPNGFHSWTLLARAQWLEIHLFMSGYLLSSQGDRMAMAHSVEGRYPFLDHRIMKFCASLPEKFKLNGLTEKYLLKKLMHQKIPEAIIKRSKQAYRAPAAFKTLQGEFPDLIHSALNTEKIKQYGIFEPKATGDLLSRYLKGQAMSEIHNMALIGMASSQLLYQQFIDQPQKNKKGQRIDLQTKKVIIKEPGIF